MDERGAGPALEYRPVSLPEAPLVVALDAEGLENLRWDPGQFRARVHEHRLECSPLARRGAAPATKRIIQRGRARAPRPRAARRAVPGTALWSLSGDEPQRGRGPLGWAHVREATVVSEGARRRPGRGAGAAAEVAL